MPSSPKHYSTLLAPSIDAANDKSGTRKPRNDKSGTQKPRKSVIADGDFVNLLRDNGYFPPRKRRVPPLVGKITTLSPLTLPSTHPEIAKQKPKPWRDTGDAVRGLFLHEAMASEPSVKGFTLMLSRDVEKRARAQGKHCLAWLHRRLVRQLKPLGDRYKAGAVPFIFTIEESSRIRSRRARLHIHGEISFGDVGAEKRSMRSLQRIVAPMRKALKRVGGDWEPEFDDDKHQLKFNSGTPDQGWAGYIAKGFQKVGPGRRRFMRRYGLESDRRYVAGFDGKVLSATPKLWRKAALKHAEMVKLVWRGH